VIGLFPTVVGFVDATFPYASILDHARTPGLLSPERVARREGEGRERAGS
jgi:hypothetical protein